MQQWQYESQIGRLFLVGTDLGLQGIYWNKQKVPMTKTLDGTLAKAVKELDEYFAGKRTKFDIPLDLVGTEFQKSVWKELMKIPYGKTISYSELAKKIKNAKAVRAVGSANGKNPLCIIIPCHRVIAANGTLGGYSGGLPNKEKLLAHECGSVPKRS